MQFQTIGISCNLIKINQLWDDDEFHELLINTFMVLSWFVSGSHSWNDKRNCQIFSSAFAEYATKNIWIIFRHLFGKIPSIQNFICRIISYFSWHSINLHDCSVLIHIRGSDLYNELIKRLICLCNLNNNKNDLETLSNILITFGEILNNKLEIKYLIHCKLLEGLEILLEKCTTFCLKYLSKLKLRIFTNAFEYFGVEKKLIETLNVNDLKKMIIKFKNIKKDKICDNLECAITEYEWNQKFVFDCYTKFRKM